MGSVTLSTLEHRPAAITILDVLRPTVTADSGEPGKHAHIVRKKKGWRNRKTSPQAMVLEARIAGTPVEALCGYVWVPSQNPHNLPVCAKCKAIYEARTKGFDRRLPDA